MQIIPAIDIRGGNCVRLRQGDYEKETIFAPDPAEMAKRWVEQGAKFLHLVDLDGAKNGKPVNGESVRKIIESTGVPCQLGGGIRTDDDVEDVLSWGVSRVIIGTKALIEPEWFAALCHNHPQKVVLGIDEKGGKAALQGWLEVSDQSVLELAQQYINLPLAALVYTDVSRDGMLQGPNMTAMANMAKTVPFPVIASGGVTTIDDVRKLAKHNLAGCIVGRALYEGKLNLREWLDEFPS